MYAAEPRKQKTRFPSQMEMERRSEIRTVPLKSVLSGRCNEPNALLEATVRDTRQRPADATRQQGSTVASFPDSSAFEKDPGE